MTGWPSSRRLLLFGDSHVHAIQVAIAARAVEGRSTPIEARRLLKSKTAGQESALVDDSLFSRAISAARKLIEVPPERGQTVITGDTSLRAFIAMARRLRSNDVLVSLVGGNHHSVFSTVQHPLPFDVLLPGEMSPRADDSAELVPFRALYGHFAAALRLRDQEMFATLRKSTRAKVVHLLAPPPKRDNAFIQNYHDTQFAAEGIDRLGVSDPELRMKFWKLQNRAVEEICTELGIEVIGPPAAACDPDGFLARACYARDATHANVKYGELVLEQLEARFLATSLQYQNAGPR